MSLAAARRASNPGQPNTVTEIKYSSLNSTALDHGQITGTKEHQVTTCVTSFGTVQAFRQVKGSQSLLGAALIKLW
jgi:hypothetical protein